MGKSEVVNNVDEKEFWQELRSRVNSYFKENEIRKTANSYYYIKAFIMGAILWMPMAALVIYDLTAPWYLLMWFIMGVGMAGVGMNVMHDANHESVSRKKNVNRFFGASMYLLSGNVFNWKVQHNVLHHTYTNLYGKDDDIDAGGLLRLHPNEPYKGAHKFQVFYAPFLYGLLTLNWVIYKDFKQLADYSRRGITKQMRTTFAKEFVVLVISKIAYYSVFMALPLLMGYSVWITILGFVLMHFTAGFILSLIFQMAHVVDDVKHPENSDMNPNRQFANHQLATTSNFATRSWLVTFYTGGLNHQVEHHLFPNICHVHYPRIARIVKETASEFKVPYYEHSTFMKALKSHIRYMKEMGQPA